MKVSPTSLPGVLLIEPQAVDMDGAFFVETFQAERYGAAGIAARFVQDNWARYPKGTLRGLHYQDPHAQGKLVQCLRGAVFDVAVDIRRESPSFGKWFGAEISDLNRLQLWIPPGFAHGYCVLSEWADFAYKCTDFYAPECEHAIAWDDPRIGIRWPVERPRLSKKDAVAPCLER